MSEATKPHEGTIRGSTVALVLLTAMNFVNYLDRYILPAVQEQVKGEFHLTDEHIGRLTFFFFVAYVCASPITGWLGDRFPRKRLVLGGLIAWSVPHAAGSKKGSGARITPSMRGA